MFRNRWVVFAIVAFVLMNIFSHAHDAREEQRAYQDGYMAGQMAALAAQNNGAGTVPPVMNPYNGYNGGWGYRGGGPNFFGFLFIPVLLIGGFMVMRLRRRLWAHAAWHGETPAGPGFSRRGPWGSPESLRHFGRHGRWGHGGPGGFPGRPGGDRRYGSGYWWRDGDTPPNTPERPVQPAPAPTEEGDDATV